jgi:hypothetical protein
VAIEAAILIVMGGCREVELLPAISCGLGTRIVFLVTTEPGTKKAYLVQGYQFIHDVPRGYLHVYPRDCLDSALPLSPEHCFVSTASSICVHSPREQIPVPIGEMIL